MAKRLKFDTPSDLIQNHINTNPFIPYKDSEKEIRTKAKVITEDLTKHFSKSHVIIEHIENEFYRPPFAVWWAITEKKDTNGESRPLQSKRQG